MTTTDDDAQGRDEQRVAEIRDCWQLFGKAAQDGQEVNAVGLSLWYAEHVGELLQIAGRQKARLGALEAERDEWKAKAEQQAQLKADFRAAYQAAQQAGYDMEALRDRAGAERDDALARLAAAESALARKDRRCIACYTPHECLTPGSECVCESFACIGRRRAALAGSREGAGRDGE